MARTQYCKFHEYDRESGEYREVVRLLVCTHRKVRVELGRTMDNIKCVRSIWKDEDGNEYVRHARFTQPLTIGYLDGHGSVTRMEV